MTPSKGRVVQIRRHTYRDRVGFLVVECGGNGFGARIFTTTRTSAERIRVKVKRGERTTLADFAP